MDGIDDNTIIDREALKKFWTIPEHVLAAVENTDRLPFLPGPVVESLEKFQPIGCDQTMSAKWMVAWQLSLLDVGPLESVLEIGGGCGYLAAVLAKLTQVVHIVEYHKELAQLAAKNNNGNNVNIWLGNGFLGIPEKAPFSRVVVSCAIPDISTLSGLVRQLTNPARMIAPVHNPKDDYDYMTIVDLNDGEADIHFIDYPLVFVPALGCLRMTPPRQIC